MSHQHLFILVCSMAFLSTIFYLLISANPSFYERNDQAETITYKEISDVEIPITWSDQGHILLPVSVNGTTDLLFGLDTGAPLTVIFGHEGTEAVPLLLGHDFAVGGNGTGNPSEGKIVESIEIAIGPVTIDGLNGVWIDWRNVPFFPSESHVYLDGIIGYDLFSRFLVEIDTTNEFLRFHQSWKTISSFSGKPIPIRIKNRKPYGNVEVIIDEEIPTPIIREAHIDTGSIDQLELITPSVPTAIFPELPIDLIPSSGMGFRGKVEAEIGRVDRLTFGHHSFKGILIEFANEHGGAAEGEAQLGMGILSRFNLIFDYRGKQLFMIERADSFADFDLDMSGLEIVRSGNQTVVKNVAPGTSAERANFRPGDKITEIEGIPASQLKKVRFLLRSGDGKKISVCRETRKGEKCKMLRLQRQI